MKHNYGWKKDRPDARDLVRAVRPRWTAAPLPEKVDLRPKCPPVYDQLNLGSCSAQAIAAAHQYHQAIQGANPAFMPSRLFIYYNERAMEGTIREDAGATLRDGMKTINKDGVCPEPMWPYDVTQFAKRPSIVCYNDALNHQALRYERVEQLEQHVKTVLAEGDFVICGIMIYESFESRAVAVGAPVPMPKPLDEKCLGGHAVCLVGYDDATRMFVLRNSWGEAWGMKGYTLIPYDYILDSGLAADFWALTLVERADDNHSVPASAGPGWFRRMWNGFCSWF